MSMMAGLEGTFVIAWSQTCIDGWTDAPYAALSPGSVWAWHGEPVCIDAALDGRIWAGERRDTHRRRTATGTRRLVSKALALEGFDHSVTETSEPDKTFRVTDGHRTWTGTLIEIGPNSRPFLMFTNFMPPAGVPLTIREFFEPIKPNKTVRRAAEGVVCFTPGTLLDTPNGLKPVETIVAGDQVVTKDAGPQHVIWVGCRKVSGARLYATPELCPVRIHAGALGDDRPNDDLLVSPDHRMLIGGKLAKQLSQSPEVLVSAQDLVNGQSVTRETQLKSVTYYHVMLANHHVIIANGMETESFHPAAARLDEIAEDQKMRLFDVMPELAGNTANYGPMIRETVTSEEAIKISSAA